MTINILNVEEGFNQRHEVRLQGNEGSGSTNNLIMNFSSPEVVNEGTSITYSSDAVNGDSFTINDDGIYAIGFNYVHGAQGFLFGISLNANVSTVVQSLPDANLLAHVRISSQNDDGAVYATSILSNGDIIRPHCSGTPNTFSGNYRVWWYIIRLA